MYTMIGWNVYNGRIERLLKSVIRHFTFSEKAFLL